MSARTCETRVSARRKVDVRCVVPELVHTTPQRVQPLSIADEIKTLETRLAALRLLQREQLVARITLVVGENIVFSAADLWDHQVVSPELQTAFLEAGLTSRRKLGKKLHQLTACGLVRWGEDRNGVVWMVVRQ